MPNTTTLKLTKDMPPQAILSGAGGVTMQARSSQVEFAVSESGSPSGIGHVLRAWEPTTWRTVAGETLYVWGDGVLVYTLEG